MAGKMLEFNPNDNELKTLFEKNRQWAARMVDEDPDYFLRLVTQQLPKYFWIGCSDSRVPSTQITNLLPGDIFTHRNVANVVSYTDLSCLAVMQFAVDVLRVRHVIVTGHYDCSGVHVALKQQRVGLADNWLRHVQDVHHKHERYLGEALSEQMRYDRLCELNVIESVANVCHTTIIQDAWNRGQRLTVHGWVYGVHDGLLRDLGMVINSLDELEPKMQATLKRYEEDGEKFSGRNWLPE
ncbi:MAG: carbonate dehydratase [Betaproteobacteria bacterium]|nr:carbonate dehydratase [Betaproteobacteria bacterium]